MNRKLNFGCGSNRLEGWENMDCEVDISKPLPFPDQCVSHIFAEHVVEHISYQEAFEFFKECLRVFQPLGVIRIAVPDLGQVADGLYNRWEGSGEYIAAVKRGGHGNGSEQSCLTAVMFQHGHRAIWTTELLTSVMWAAGFPMAKLKKANYGSTWYDGMGGLEGHGKVVGEIVAKFETGIVEGMKL